MSGTESGELLDAVRQFLRGEILPELEGFKAYQTRVAANALGIVARELEMGGGLAELDRQIAASLSLREEEGPVTRQIALALRDGNLVANSQLTSYLRKRTLLGVSIDNPKYAGLREARKRWGDIDIP